MTRASPRAESLKTLELFDEKVDELLSSSFFAQARGGGAIVEFRRNVGWEAVHVGPDDESTSALILTLRLFIQDNERLSIRRMSTLYRSLPLSGGLVDEFESRRAKLNAFLDSASNLAIEDGRQLTHREIFEVFVYGTYAHVSPAERDTYEELRTTPFFPLFQATLVKTIMAFGQALHEIKLTNLQALQELRASSS